MGSAQTKKFTFEKIILPIVLVVIGVLLCMKIAANTLNIIIGVALIAYGVFTLLYLILKKESIVSRSGFFACIIMAIGIVFVAKKLLGAFIALVPYALIVIGAVMIIDAFLGKYYRRERSVLLFCIKLIFGVALVAFSICILTIAKFAAYASIVFGIMLIVFALFIVCAGLFGKR